MELQDLRKKQRNLASRDRTAFQETEQDDPVCIANSIIERIRDNGVGRFDFFKYEEARRTRARNAISVFLDRL